MRKRSKTYTKDNRVNCNLENFKPPKKLDQEQQSLHEKEISMEEMSNCIKAMACNKTPGTDGFPVNFYIIFFQKIKELLLAVFHQALAKGCLHTTAREGIITLIPKKERDQLYVRNWRPITLLNTDYKILAKIFGERMKLVLNDIISPDQSGFLKGRNISDNLRIILDTMEFTEIYQIPAVFISVDFEKAFDRVDYQARQKILEKFNFGEKFRAAIQTLFNEFRLVTTNMGYNSNPLTPTRGLFQGNRISSYLFLILIELLASQIRQNKDIKGVKVKNEEVLLIQFADDLGLVLDFQQKSWEATVKTFSTFETQSGMRINYEKSLVYRMGSLRDSNAKFYSQRKLI